MHLPVFLIALFAAGFLFAKSAQSSELNCKHPKNQKEMTDCSFIAKQAAEVSMSVAFNRAKEYLVTIEGHTPDQWKGSVEALAKAQKSWLAYRKQHCRSYGLKFGGGDLLPMLINTCESELTQERTAELNALAEEVL